LKIIFFALCTRHPEQREGTCCMNDSLFFPLIAAGVASVFCLETKGTKTSRKNDASTAPKESYGHRAKHLARRSFIPPRGYSASLGINFH
jgi:hypothetical protein